MHSIVNTKRYAILGLLAIVAFFIFSFTSTTKLFAQTAPPVLPAGAALGTPCPGVASGASIADGFGAPYNVFSGGHELLLTPFCIDKGFIARFGYDTSGASVAIYRSGYRWDGTRWVALSFSSDGGITSGSYIIGKAKSSTQKYASSPETSFVAFTCTYTGATWKCGCKDNACSTPYWQLQTAVNVFAWHVTVTAPATAVERSTNFNVSYKNNGDQPIVNCPYKVWLEYLSGSSWRKYSLHPTGITSSACLTTLLNAGQTNTVSFILPLSATDGTWRAAYGPDSSHIFYSANFTVNGGCTDPLDPKCVPGHP